MRIIGLTGSIACGKSTVSDYLRRQPDCAVIDGDQLSRQLTAPGGQALPMIRNVFGPTFFLSDGTLNRSRLASLVFSDPQSLRKLDELMAPLLSSLTNEQIEAARQAGFSLCFLEFPLLFEKGYDSLCESVWCVYLPRALQLQRLMARDGLSEQEALARINSVLSSEEKAARSQVVIDNSGSVSYTLSILPALLEAERASAAAPPRRRRSEKYPVPSVADMSPSGPDIPRASVRRAAAWQNQPAAVSSPAAPAPAGIPPSLARPDSARKRSSVRKSAWMLPSWLMITLISVSFLILCSFTALSLMRGYLVSRQEQHLAEQQAILDRFPLEYRSLISRYSEEYNLQPAFVTAVILNESSFQPRAESKVGARGLMQLMPDTAEWIARKLKTEGWSFDRMNDPESNIRFGCWYLNYLSVMFRGDPVCVICAYHAGQGQVASWLSDPLISDDGITISLSRLVDGPTKVYAGKVIRAYGIYQKLYFSADSASPDGVPPVPSV